MEVTVSGAATTREAKLAAHAVATSPLVKTALHGGDPNWGRILAAVGRSGARFSPRRTSLSVGRLLLVSAGEPGDYRERDAARIFAQERVPIAVDLGAGIRHGLAFWRATSGTTTCPSIPTTAAEFPGTTRVARGVMSRPRFEGTIQTRADPQPCVPRCLSGVGPRVCGAPVVLPVALKLRLDLVELLAFVLRAFRRLPSETVGGLVVRVLLARLVVRPIFEGLAPVFRSIVGLTASPTVWPAAPPRTAPIALPTRAPIGPPTTAPTTTPVATPPADPMAVPTGWEPGSLRNRVEILRRRFHQDQLPVIHVGLPERAKSVSRTMIMALAAGPGPIVCFARVESSERLATESPWMRKEGPLTPPVRGARPLDGSRLLRRVMSHRSPPTVHPVQSFVPLDFGRSSDRSFQPEGRGAASAARGRVLRFAVARLNSSRTNDWKRTCRSADDRIVDTDLRIRRDTTWEPY